MNTNPEKRNFQDLFASLRVHSWLYYLLPRVFYSPLMSATEHEMLLKEEVFQIVGAAMEVLNGIGHGLHEKPYENALAVEFGLRNIPFQQQPCFDVIYKEVKVSEYVPDLIAYETVVVDTKVIDSITGQERGQMLNYLRITGLAVGVVLNFKRSKLEWERLVLTDTLPLNELVRGFRI